MKKLYILLYSILFINTSLLAVEYYNYQDESVSTASGYNLDCLGYPFTDIVRTGSSSSIYCSERTPDLKQLYSHTFQQSGTCTLTETSTANYFNRVTTITTDYVCGYTCSVIKTDEECQVELSDDTAFFDESTCSCKKPCQLVPDGYDLVMELETYDECTYYYNEKVSLGLEGYACSSCPATASSSEQYALILDQAANNDDNTTSPDENTTTTPDNNTTSDADGDGIEDNIDSNPIDPNDSNECTPIDLNDPRLELLQVDHSQCYVYSTMLNRFLENKTYVYVSANYDSCRRMCLAKFQYCNDGYASISGRCMLPEPDSSECSVTPDCANTEIGIVGEDGESSFFCTRRCWCLDTPDKVRDETTLIMETEVSCADDDHIDQEEDPYDPFSDLDDSETNFNTDQNVTDPLAEHDENSTIDYDQAKTLKSALESYDAAKEETQKLMGKELEKQTKEQLKQTEIQNKILQKLEHIHENDQIAKNEARSDANMINNSINNLNNNLSQVATESTQSNILNKLDEILNKTASSVDIKNALSDALSEADLNISVSSAPIIGEDTSSDTNDSGSDTNDTGEDNESGWDQNDIENAITDQFTQKYDLFSVECGQPVFDPAIEFMGVTVENPLPIMHQNTEQYFEVIKTIVILGATLSGLLTIFRR